MIYKMKKPIIWMNKTTSYNWNRPVVGIVRVETELAEQLRKLYPEGVFKECIWNGEQFIELSQCLSKANNPPLDKKNIKSDFYPLLPIVTRRQALLNFAQGMLSIAPSSFRPIINKLLLWIKPKAISVYNFFTLKRYALRSKRDTFFKSQVLNNSGEKQKNNGPEKTNEIIFSAGDIFISIGLDWDYSYYKDFYNIRTKAGVRVITCCYDLIPVLYPQYCVANVATLFSSYFMELADGSDEVICISKQSQADLVNLLSCTGSRQVNTSVFELGDNVPESSEVVSDSVNDLINDKFILFVSSIERRKNHEVIYRAYHLLGMDGRSLEIPKVVFVGMPGWGVNDLLKDIELDPMVKDKIFILNHVNDAELRKLYENTLFCVFPSLYEGWGLPVGEALSLGKPVLSSDRGSLPEVAGDLAIYIDPWNPRAWADNIYKLSSDDDYRNGLSKKILKEYNKRTWDKTGMQVKRILDKYIL